MVHVWSGILFLSLWQVAILQYCEGCALLISSCLIRIPGSDTLSNMVWGAPSCRPYFFISTLSGNGSHIPLSLPTFLKAISQPTHHLSLVHQYTGFPVDMSLSIHHKCVKCYGSFVLGWRDLFVVTILAQFHIIVNIWCTCVRFVMKSTFSFTSLLSRASHKQCQVVSGSSESDCWLNRFFPAVMLETLQPVPY